MGTEKDVAEALKVPATDRSNLEPSRTGDGFVKKDQGMVGSGGPTAPDADPAKGTQTPSAQAATQQPKTQALEEVKPASGVGNINHHEGFRVMDDGFFVAFGQRVKYSKGDIINPNHHRPGTVTEMKRQGLKLQKIEPGEGGSQDSSGGWDGTNRDD